MTPDATVRRSAVFFASRKKAAAPVSHHWKRSLRRGLAGLLAATTALCLPARAVVLAIETFDTDMAGWVDRDPGDMAVSHAAGVGNPAGSLSGAFLPQGFFPVSQTDAFRADAGSSAGAFVGDYHTTHAGFTSFTFDLFADTTLPSDVILRISDGTGTFFYNVAPQFTSVGTWNSVLVPLTFAYGGWYGGSSAQFSNVLAQVAHVEVQISRSGTSGATYLLDNFALTSDTILFVPEPGSAFLLVFGFFLLRRYRHRLFRNRSPYANPA